MNKHIELVENWLADPDSVTREQLKANRDSALDELKNFADYTVKYNAYNAAFYAYVASYDQEDQPYSAWNGSDIAAEYVAVYNQLTGEI